MPAFHMLATLSWMRIEFFPIEECSLRRTLLNVNRRPFPLQKLHVHVCALYEIWAALRKVFFENCHTKLLSLSGDVNRAQGHDQTNNM